MAFITFKNSSHQNNTIEVVINLDELDNQETLENLKENFKRSAGIEFIGASLSANTIILKVDKGIEETSFYDLLNNSDVSVNDIYIKAEGN